MELVNHNNLPEFVSRIYEETQEIKRQLSQRLPEPQKPKENLLSEEALTFLKEQGYPITETTLNKKCSLGEIPYKIQGKRRNFSRSQLLAWLSQGCPNIKELKAIDLLALNTRK